MNLLIKNLTGVIALLFVSIYLNSNAQENVNLNGSEEKIEKFLTYFSNDNPGAVVLVVKNDEVLFNKAYGLSNVQQNDVMTIDKCFNLAELSKSFTSLAVLKLVEKNKLSLDNNLKDIFPDFPEYGKNIKIRNLLNHTSGLVNYNKNEIETNDAVYEFLINQNNTVFEPGTKWMHSNSDYALLVKVIEKVSRKSYKSYLNKNVFKKLGMTNTFFADEIGNKNIAENHFKVNEKYILKNDISKVFGEQGIYTNSIDYSKYASALFTNKLLKSENLEKIFLVDKLSNGKDVPYYGYGWTVMKKSGIKYNWHGGTQGGYSNLVLQLPDTKMTVLILTNRNDGYDFLKMAIYIAKIFDKELKL